jgi:putative flippase GtrA
MKREILRFGLAGLLGFVVDVCILYVVLALGVGFFFGRCVSFTAAVWTTWRINRRFTFAPTPNLSPWNEWWRYMLAMLGGGMVNYAAYSAAVLLLSKTPLLPMYAVGIGSISGMAVNFLGAKLWVFKEFAKKNSNEK